MLFCVTVLWWLYSTTRHSATCAKNTLMLQFWCALLCCASAQVTSLGLLLRLLYCNWWVILLVICSACLSAQLLVSCTLLACFHAFMLPFWCTVRLPRWHLVVCSCDWHLLQILLQIPSMQHSSNSNPRHYLFIIKTWFEEIKKRPADILIDARFSLSTPNHPQCDILQTLP